MHYPTHYPTSLVNVVMVKKPNGKWRIYIDFTNLNKACPNDSFPLPRIDQLVDAITGHESLTFMNGYSGYNQIQMHPSDREKTTLITNKGLYCYNVILFVLKNTGAIYHRLVNKIFVGQIERNMEVYVDDMLIKSKKMEYHIANLEEAFKNLKHFNMKLNPSKCAFGVSSKKFLRFMVSQ